MQQNVKPLQILLLLLLRAEQHNNPELVNFCALFLQSKIKYLC